VTDTRALRIGLYAIIRREIAKFIRQRERLISALVRPLLWLVVFATGLNNLLGVSIVPPYSTYTPYQEYIVPGLVGIIVLFQSMQSALSMVYDREAGVMRVMLVSPLPRRYLLFAKILAAALLATLQVYVFIAVTIAFGIHLPVWGLLWMLPAVLLSGIMLGSVGLLISIFTRQIENFAGMMNFVIFPMFFFSSALYPLWKLREADAWPIWIAAQINPFTHAVELVRFALYGQFAITSCAVVAGVAVGAFLLAARGYDPATGRLGRVSRA
jgi:ABC-2 type transport system permease protein